GENELVGQSAVMRDVRRLIDIVAPSKTTILIQGATGTGKELVAQSIHKLSSRKGEMVSINCSAIPAELLESELFGYEKGAFTGAEKMRQGRFEMASGGTLFLDEIGDMPLPLQAKLLRAIESRTIQRVGGGKDVPIDLRLVCATHQNIEADIEAGKFRADLFYRINVFPIKIPELAERTVDIPLIVKALKKAIEKQNDFLKLPDFDESAMQEFMRYTWPGNVRELRNVVERACLLFPGSKLEGKHVRDHLLRLRAPDPAEEQDALWAATADLGMSPPKDPATITEAPLPHPTHYKDWFAFFDNIDLRRHLQEVEVVLIEAALEKSDGMVSLAADSLKLRRTTLIEKMKKLLIQKPTL
ncbi:sigma-54 dependent transcriptional regulator, partial [Alphaproteobacteria bacterium]|nr:sigma-54 dependent transcriptional regulator [Alphaproteobacteria bacterium]